MTHILNAYSHTRDYANVTTRNVMSLLPQYSSKSQQFIFCGVEKCALIQTGNIQLLICVLLRLPNIKAYYYINYIIQCDYNYNVKTASLLLRCYVSLLSLDLHVALFEDYIVRNLSYFVFIACPYCVVYLLYTMNYYMYQQ